MSNAQSWTLLGMVGLLLGSIGSLLVHQVRLVGDRIDARIVGLESTFDARFVGLESTMDARFDAVDQRFNAVDQRFDAVDRRFDHLDRDVQAIARVVFPRD